MCLWKPIASFQELGNIDMQISQTWNIQSAFFAYLFTEWMLKMKKRLEINDF